MIVEAEGLPQKNQHVTRPGKTKHLDGSIMPLHDTGYTIIQLLDEESILHIGSAV